MRNPFERMLNRKPAPEILQEENHEEEIKALQERRAQLKEWMTTEASPRDGISLELIEKKITDLGGSLQ